MGNNINMIWKLWTFTTFILCCAYCKSTGMPESKYRKFTKLQIDLS